MSRFLYIGSNDSKVLSLRKSLESSSYSGSILDIVPSREEAHSSLTSNNYDLVFIQEDFAGSNFIELLRTGEWCLPAVILTSESAPRVTDDILKTGAIDCLSLQDLEQGLLSRAIRYAQGIRESWLILRSHEALHQSLSSIIESSEDAIFSETTDGVILTWNRGAEKLFGYSAEEAIGQTFELVTPPERVAEKLSLLERVRNGERTDHHETLRRHKNGNLINISLSVSPIFDSTGRVVGTSGIARDNTSQKRDQEELRRSQEIYQALVRNFPNGSVYMIDLDARFILAEGRGLAPIGLSSEKVVGKTISEVFGDTDLARNVSAVYSKALTGVEAIIETEIHGRIRLLHVLPVRNEQSVVVSVLAMTQDITEQKRSQAALERSEKLYSTLARNFPNGSVFLLDKDLNFVLAEGRGLPQVGTDRAQWIGKSVQEVFRDTSGADDAVPLYKQALTGKEVSAEVFLNGTHRWLHALPIRENGTISGVMAMSQDITELKRTEQALRESEELNQAILDSMLANIVVLDQHGNITALNEPWRKFARESSLNDESFPDYAIGTNYLDTCSLTMRDATQQSVGVAEGIREVLNGQRASFSLEYSCHFAHQKHWFQMTVTPLSQSRGGAVVAHIPTTERKLAEEELERNQEQLTMAQSIAHSGHMLYDAELGKSFWSDEAYRIFGLEPQSIEGSYAQFLKFVHPDDLGLFSTSTPEFYGTKGTIQNVFRIIRPDGEIRWLQGQAQGYHDDEGRLSSFIGTVFDITDLKQAQDERDRFFELSLDMMIISDTNGYFKRVNPACTRVLGYSSEELKGRPFIEFVHPDDREATIVEATRIYSGDGAEKFENRYLCRDGSYKLLEWNWTFHSETGLIYSVCSDITERKRAELEILESRNRLSSIVNSAMDAIITTDESMRVLLFNPAAEKMFGYSSSEMISQPINRLIPERYHAHHPEHIAIFNSNGLMGRRIGESGAVYGLRSNGEEFPLEASLSQTQLEDQKLFTVILRDITERERAELELRNSQELLEVALYGGQIGLWEWNAVDNSVRFSGFFKQQLGYEDDEFDDNFEAFLNALHPDDLPASMKRIQEHIQGDATHYSDEFRMRCKDGHYIWVLSQGTVFRDANGTVHRVLGSHIDITGLKLAEEELILSSEVVRQAHDELELRVEERTAELARANQALKNESDERQQTLVALQDAVIQLEQARDATERANTELRANELRLINGNRIFTELTRIRVVVETELEEALQAITQAGSEVLALERCSVWLYNEDQTAIKCLDLYERTQNRHSQGLELSVSDFPHYFEALRTRVSITSDDAHTHPATREFSATYLTPLGISSMLDTPIVLGGQMVGVLCCEQVGEPRHWKVEDQTLGSSLASICSLALESLERARAESALRQAKNEAESAREEAERANQAKSEFLSRMSHELRTPMNSILGFAQILEMSATNEKQLQRVSHIMKAGRHLLQLINEVLDVARVESGQLSLSPEPVQIGSTIEMAVDLVRPLCHQNNLRLELDIGNFNNGFVQADQQRLSQVLLNLLSNAAKYNRENGFIKIRCDEGSNGKIRVNVIDNGHGIATEDLPKLFQPFERLGREIGSIEGTGLGLALSKRIMQAMGGSIGAESEVGIGSTFWIELPLVEGPMEQLNVPSGELMSRIPKTTTPHTVLYIEDNIANFKVLEHLILTEPNIALISAMQGQIGLELARQHLPSLILLDLHLPDIPGEEVLRRILAEPKLAKIPVIILSADATPTQITRLLAAGATAYLTKPLDLQEFLAVMHKYLSLQAQ